MSSSLSSSPRRLQNGWLEGYMKFVDQQESPKNFHFFTGLSLLSAAVRRNIWVDQFYFEVFPNLYTTLIAVSAMCRKSIAAEIGIGLLQKVKDIHVFEAKTSTEGFIDEIGQAAQSHLVGSKVVTDSSIMIFASEMSVFFSSATYSSDLIHILTDAYGGKDPFRYKLKRQEISVPKFSPSLLCCTTPSLLAKIMTTEATTGGFTGRMLYIVETSPGPRIAWLRGTPELEKLKSDLIHDLTHISNLYGRFTFNPAAEKYYDEWYQALQPTFEDNRFAGYFQRKHIHVLKLATLLGVSRSDSLVGDVSLIQGAIRLLDNQEKTAQSAFKYVGSAAFALGEDVIDCINRNSGIVEYKSLVKALRYQSKSNQEFVDVVTGLVEAGEIAMKTANGVKYAVAARVGEREFNGWVVRMRAARMNGNGPDSGVRK